MDTTRRWAGAKKDLLLNDDGVLRDRSDQLPLVSGSPVTTDARDVFVGDFDGDSWPDLAIATTCNTAPRFYQNRGPSGAGVWLGFQDMTAMWQPSPYSPADGQHFCAVAGGDIDGIQTNGPIDLFLSNYDKLCFGESGPRSNSDHLLINDLKNSGRFVDDTVNRLGTNQLLKGAFGTAAEIHDTGNDGKQDILRVRDGPVDVLRNLGNPSNFASDQSPQSIEGDLAYMATGGDLNNDGFIDFYVVRDQRDRVFVATPAPTPTPPSYTAPTQAPGVGGPGTRTAYVGGNVKMAQVDSTDLDPDVGVADVDVDENDSCNVCDPTLNTCRRSPFGACTFPNHDTCPEDNMPDPSTNRAFALLRNTGNFTADLQDPWPDTANQSFHRRTYDFAFLDINGDGCTDLFQGLCRGYKVFIQNCPSTGTP